MSGIILREHQVGHYDRINSIIRNFWCYADFSPTGSGKTYVTLRLAFYNAMKLLVICPAIMVHKWAELSEKYKVPVEEIMSFQKLSGMKGKVSHKYLQVKLLEEETTSSTIKHTATTAAEPVEKSEEKKTNYEYLPSPEFIELITKESILLVIDEAHFCKNNSTLRSKAVHCLTRAIATAHSTSRICLLSATPLDKTSQAECVLKDLGFLDEEPCQIRGKRVVMMDSLLEFIAFCKRINSRLVESLPPIHNVRDLRNFCYELFKQVILKHIRSLMPSPKLEFDGQYSNYFYLPSNDEDKEAIANGNEQLRVAVKGRMNERGEFITDWSKITKALETIEKGKIGIAERVTKDILTSVENSKIVISAFFINTIETMAEKLEKYNPLILDGKVEIKDRKKIIADFQKDDNKYRVIIVNPSVGGIGIDLDDVWGNRPRYLFIFPSYRYTEIVQMCGRVLRSDTKSEPIIRLIYSATEKTECKVLENLSSKSEVMEEITTSTAKSLYPGKFQMIEETEDGRFLEFEF